MELANLNDEVQEERSQQSLLKILRCISTEDLLLQWSVEIHRSGHFCFSHELSIEAATE